MSSSPPLGGLPLGGLPLGGPGGGAGGPAPGGPGAGGGGIVGMPALTFMFGLIGDGFTGGAWNSKCLKSFSAFLCPAMSLQAFL